MVGGSFKVGWVQTKEHCVTCTEFVSTRDAPFDAIVELPQLKIVLPLSRIEVIVIVLNEDPAVAGQNVGSSRLLAYLICLTICDTAILPFCFKFTSLSDLLLTLSVTKRIDKTNVPVAVTITSAIKSSTSVKPAGDEM